MNNISNITNEFSLQPSDNKRLANLCGKFDEHLRQLESRFDVKINNRGHNFNIIGLTDAVQNVTKIIKQLYNTNDMLEPANINLVTQESNVELIAATDEPDEIITQILTRRGIIKPKGANQNKYVDNIVKNDINFGIGPAGTGKTYLAVACAVDALEQELIRRLILVRPAVEAGEKLGFLPGDLAQKVDPYLRPLYDALYEMLGFERVAKLIERQVIEIAPLAYMRGRTLNDSFIILDEAQNTTTEQMKMFLTRIGFGSTAIVTGDITQIDLPRDNQSGLKHIIDILKNVEGISFTFFNSKDVVRHPIVARIINAYEQAERNK